MSLSAKYSKDLRHLLSPSAQKTKRFSGPFDVRSRQLSKLGSSLHIALELKILSNLKISTLRIGSYG